MVKNCVVAGCSSESYRDCGISFHKFPKDDNLKMKWLEAIRNEITWKEPVICSRHFRVEDYKSDTTLRRLKVDAVPSLLLMGSNNSMPKFIFNPTPKTASESGEKDTKPPANLVKMAVEDVKPVMACQACLVTSTEQPLRVFDSKLADAYKLMVSAMQHPDLIPKYICTYCRALLFKFMSFREKCLESQTTLLGMQTIMDVPITLDVLYACIPTNTYPLQTTTLETVSYDPPPTNKTKESVDTFGKQSADVINEISEVNKPASEIAVHMQPSEHISRIRIRRPRTVNEECSQNELKMEHTSEHSEDNIEYLEDIDMVSEYLEDDIEYLEDIDTDDTIYDIKPDKELGLEISQYFDDDLKSPKIKADTTTTAPKKVKNTKDMKCMMIQMDSIGLEIDIGNWSNEEKSDIKIEAAADEPLIYECPVLPETQMIPETYIETHKKKEAFTKEKQFQQIEDCNIQSKYKCNVCGSARGFHSKIAFENHSKMHELCNKVHDSSIKLPRHTATKCTTKNKRRKNSKTLAQKSNKDRERQNKKRISKSHDKIKLFICESCGCIKQTKQKLEIHMRVHHTKEYTCECDYCGKRYFFKNSLQNHIWHHMGISLACKYCGKSYANEPNRYRHEITVHGGLRFKCEICATTFTTKRGMRDHVRHTHEGVPRPKRLRIKRNRHAARDTDNT